jgi:Tfp pilus assembly protein PilE
MKLFRRNLKAVRASAQKGFTLIELAVVGLFLGLLAVFAITQFSNASTDKAKANSLNEAVSKVADNWALLVMECGASKSIGGTTASAATNKANLSFLMGTASALPTAPTGITAACVAASGIRPLVGLSSGGAGAEKINGYTVEVADIGSAGSGYIGVTFKAVPKGVFDAALEKFGPGGAAAASVAAATTTPFAYGTAAADGARDVTFVRPL